MPDLMPAPGSMAISAPSAFIFFTVSGVAATRGSAGSISTGMAIFMGVRCGSRQEGADGGDCLSGKVRFVTRKVGASHQLFKPRLVRVARLAGMIEAGQRGRSSQVGGSGQIVMRARREGSDAVWRHGGERAVVAARVHDR